MGEPLSALPGSELADGDFFMIDTTFFEFDMGFSLNVPHGAGTLIQDGETFTLDDGTAQVTYEFDRDGAVAVGNNPIPIASTDTADVIIQAIEAAITANGPPGITPHIFRNRIHLEGATDVTQSANPAVVLEGDAPGTVSLGAVPIVIHAGMTRLEVATEMALAIDAEFAAQAGNTDDPNFLTSVKLIKIRSRLSGTR